MVALASAALGLTWQAAQAQVPPGARVAQDAVGNGAQGSRPGPQGLGQRVSPTFDTPQDGVVALGTDLFTSKNFYKDQASWSNPAYFRCNTPRQLTDIWTSHRIGDGPPTSAKWGSCKVDLKREQIVSPYAYKSAKEHYAALMAQARSHGGPTVYTRANLPDWEGYYTRDQQADHGAEWIWGTNVQVPTILSLLTPEYQKRMVQMNYHEAVNNSPQWNASLCYPEGFMRFWSQASQGGNFQLMMSPAQVQTVSGIAANFLRQTHIGAPQHVQKVPQWYGETIGFWDGETLVTWTAQVQPWTLSHSMFEYSGQIETVEIWKPVKDAAGQVVALDHETVFYDPTAFVQPLRATYRYGRRATLDDPERRHTYIECLSNIRNVDGHPRQLTREDARFVDYYGRPWAQNWEQWFEKGWDKPEDNAGVSKDVLDIFN
jgi:hypothetical protein